MAKKILYRKAFIRMTKNNLWMFYLPLIQYSDVDSRGRIGPKRWTVLQGAYRSFLYTKESYDIVIADFQEKTLDGEEFLKNRQTAFDPIELAAWLRAGFTYAYTLEEYMAVGNKLAATLDGRTTSIFQEFQLQKYIRERKECGCSDFWFRGQAFASPLSAQRTAAKEAKRADPSREAYVLISERPSAWPTYFCKTLKHSVKSTTWKGSREVRHFNSALAAEKYISENREKLRQHYYNWKVTSFTVCAEGA